MKEPIAEDLIEERSGRVRNEGRYEQFGRRQFWEIVVLGKIGKKEGS